MRRHGSRRISCWETVRDEWSWESLGWPGLGPNPQPTRAGGTRAICQLWRMGLLNVHQNRLLPKKLMRKPFKKRPYIRNNNAKKGNLTDTCEGPSLRHFRTNSFVKKNFLWARHWIWGYSRIKLIYGLTLQIDTMVILWLAGIERKVRAVKPLVQIPP